MKIILVLLLVFLVVGTQSRATSSKRISDFKVQHRLKQLGLDEKDEQKLLEEIVKVVSFNLEINIKLKSLLK